MQQISALTDKMVKYIESKRNWVKDHYTPEAINEYNTISGKLTLLDTILQSNWIEKDETYKLQSLGITLGDILVQEMSFVWIEVDDEFGKSPALQLPDTTLILYPLTMISKRIEAGEDVDIYELYNGLKEKINEVKFEAG
ncbi:DUF3806 domain-containing protein [Ferruginibacter paludis]|uniref:DUF3806 domain-containing protein n=1 Tax=Ferruginibacter paludis TaxID=1310417 RepID=UPI0025B57555|nr:DUF3806 domain-containing protein [Ferruginibacter paludis]MDN3657232.1 DUF3806 domain-containing protein [Ferruginibacter paludis]